MHHVHIKAQPFSKKPSVGACCGECGGAASADMLVPQCRGGWNGSHEIVRLSRQSGANTREWL